MFLIILTIWIFISATLPVLSMISSTLTEIRGYGIPYLDFVDFFFKYRNKYGDEDRDLQMIIYIGWPIVLIARLLTILSRFIYKKTIILIVGKAMILTSPDPEIRKLAE